MGKLQYAVGDCKGSRRPENRLQVSTDGESTIDRELGIDVIATIQDLFRQIAA